MSELPNRVLIVEDNRGLSHLFSEVLEHHGLRCATAADAKDCLARIREWKPDLLILDYSLPDMDGAALIQELDRLGVLPAFLVITGHGDEKVAVQFMKMGARDYLVKDPRLLRRLPDVVKRIMGDVATQRRLAAAETSLREANQRLTMHVEHTPLAVVELDAAGTILAWNPAAAAIFGYYHEEAVGQHWRLIVPERSQPQVEEVWRRLIEQRGGSRSTNENVTKDGRMIVCDWFNTPLIDADGHTIGVTALAQDATEREQSARALRESEERFRLVSMASSDLVYSCVSDASEACRLDWLAGAVERITGYTVAELMARKNWSFLVVEEDHPLFRARVASLQPGENGVCELRLRRADGTLICVSSTARCVEDAHAPGGRRLHGALTDVTESKRLEQQYLRAQRLETLGSLASGVAHDLNNVFTPIMMSVSLLQGLARDPHEVEMVNLLEDCARRGAGILRQLLQFSRGHEGVTESVLLGDIIREISHIVQETFPRNIVFSHQVSPDLWPVRADQTQMHQVLLNLCVNARDAMSSGGHLNVTARNEQLDEKFTRLQLGARPGPHVVVRVEDSGCGMPADVLEKIFEPFFTTKPIGKGNGLGLPTVLDIARKHGGFITVESEIGRGSLFSLHLPAAPEVTDRGSGLSEPAARPAAGGLVLLIDDEPAIRFMVERTLHQVGYQVVATDDGRQATTLLTEHLAATRLAITDMMMPNVDGLETIRLLRAIKPDLPIVAISGVFGFRAELESLPPPRIFFLEKPFAIDGLLTVLQEALGTGERSP
jgi:PAS domain S-box-containing protein